MRDIDEATDAELTKNGGWLVFLLDIYLDAGTEHCGIGFIGRVAETGESGFIVYRGIGEMGSFSMGAETVGGLASGVRYSISGIDPSTGMEIEGFRDALGAGLQTRIQGRRCRLRLAALDRAATIVGSPVRLRDDLGDSLTLIDSGQRLEMILTAEGRTVDFKRIRRATNTASDHKRLHPGSPPDTFFDDDRWRREDIIWGQKKTDGDPG